METGVIMADETQNDEVSVEYETLNVVLDRLTEMSGDISSLSEFVATLNDTVVTLVEVVAESGSLDGDSSEDVKDLELISATQSALINGLMTSEQLPEQVRSQIVRWLTSQSVWKQLDEAELRYMSRRKARKELLEVVNDDDSLGEEGE